MCGETALDPVTPGADNGPSPRVRGNLVYGNAHTGKVGSIPACAGKPSRRKAKTVKSRVHPRVCGETSRRSSSVRRSPGPSPRVRGNLGRPLDDEGVGGSIPACAGKPVCLWGCPRLARVHPRVCGETCRTRSLLTADGGPSPRVRGNRPLSRRGKTPRGSIPACAGKPEARRPGQPCSRVHPRVCGETSEFAVNQMKQQGPSPRVRGNHLADRRGKLREGSIPACAGKPWRRGSASCSAAVHPRVCGETWRDDSGSTTVPGPSPRVRGNHDDRGRLRRRRGSIPACAGKPTEQRRTTRWTWVHPRVCGETTGTIWRGISAGGPSHRR